MNVAPSAKRTLPDAADDAAADLAYSRRNALQRLIRCLFTDRILDRRQLIATPDERHAWFPLWQRNAILFLADVQFAPADTIINHGSITLVAADGSRRPIETHEELIDLLRDQFDFSPSDAGIAGLKSDMANSIANDVQARRFRAAWNRELEDQIRAAGAAGLPDYLRRDLDVRQAAMFLDQWGALEGHPYYPTWKSRPGLSDAEVAALSPEFNAEVAVRIAALRADMAYVERMPHVDNLPAWFAEQFPEPWRQWKAGLNARGLDDKDWLPLPIHGWHLEAYVRRAYAAEQEEGALILDGPDVLTRPSMSFRTMMPTPPAPFIKLPVAIWMTSEQRSLQAKSIHMGPRISAVIKRILAAEDGFDGTLDIFPEEVALHYKHAIRQEDAPGRHLSAAFRGTQAAFDRPAGELLVTVATLFTKLPGNGRPFFTALIEADSALATPEAVEAFFRAYARAVTRPVVAIYLLYGIALEAHQQNSTIVFGPDNQARSLLVRDFGDGRTYAPLLAARGYTLRPYVHPGILPTVFTDDIEPVRMFVIDAAFVSHLHEVALALSNEYGFQTPRLWEILREETEAAFAAVSTRTESAPWRTERHAFLEEPWPTRSLLRMHLMQYSDYRVQHTLANPLRRGGI